MRCIVSVYESWRERSLIRTDERVWLFWAALLLLLPLNWLLAAATAACIHEAAHLAAVRLLGGRIRQIRLEPFGAVIEAEGIGGPQEALCALAGPLGSLLLVLVIHRVPLLGLCGLIQGVFNLLPVYPMDGGRTVLRLLEAVIPEQADRVTAIIEIAVFFLLLGVTVLGAIRYSLGCFPVFFCILAIGRAILRKRP